MKIRLFVLSCLFAVSTHASDRAIAERLLQETQAMDFEQSLAHVTADIVQARAPYAGGFLGEGSLDVLDTDPLYRMDRFDCTTFVETVMALASTRTFDSFINRLNLIRYRAGQISFENRNHFTEMDWNANNSLEGFIREATDQAYGSTAPRMNGVINRARFLEVSFLGGIDGSFDRMAGETVSRHGRASGTRLNRLLQDLVPVRGSTEVDVERDFNVSTPYLPIREFWIAGRPNQTLLNRIPTPAVVNVIRDRYMIPTINSRMTVSHQMILLRKPGNPTLYLRQASSSGYAGGPPRVIEQPFLEYFEPYASSTRVVGVNIQQLTLIKD